MRTKKAVWGIIACLLIAGGCKNTKQVEHLDTSRWRSGDIIFRCGNGLESKVIVNYSQGQYSHVGLLYEQENEWYVLHAVPKENNEGEPEYLKCEKVEEFLASERACSAAWGRVHCHDSIAAAAAKYALHQVRQKRTFDNDYQLTDTNYFYCSELVWQSYLHQGLDIASARGRRHTPKLLTNDVCIYPNDIEEDDDIEFIQEISYK